MHRRTRFAIFALLSVNGLVASVAIAQEPNPKETFRVAVVQFDSVPGEVDTNLDKITKLAERGKALGARFVMFHELATTDYLDDVSIVAESVPDGPTCQRIEQLARSLDCYIGVGLPERDGNRFHIAYVFFGPQGYIQRYRKTWLFRIDSDKGFRNEWSRYEPGDGPEIFELDGIRSTCLICADAASPRCVDRISALQPELVFFPVNRGAKDFDEYPAIVARFGAPTLVSNRVGISQGMFCVGGATVYDASGQVLTVANREGQEEILIYDLPVSR